jgi:hypothetical protein
VQSRPSSSSDDDDPAIVDRDVLVPRMKMRTIALWYGERRTFHQFPFRCFRAICENGADMKMLRSKEMQMAYLMILSGGPRTAISCEMKMTPPMHDGALRWIRASPRHSRRGCSRDKFGWNSSGLESACLQQVLRCKRRLRLSIRRYQNVLQNFPDISKFWVSFFS